MNSTDKLQALLDELEEVLYTYSVTRQANLDVLQEVYEDYRESEANDSRDWELMKEAVQCQLEVSEAFRDHIDGREIETQLPPELWNALAKQHLFIRNLNAPKEMSEE